MASKMSQHEAYLHNYNESRLCQLPPELLIKIGDHLSPVSMIAFRQTCQQMRKTCDLGRGTFPLNECNYTEMSALETGFFRRSLPTRLWCSLCGTRHPTHCFLEEQRQAPPLARRCPEVRLCQHRSFTRPELKALLWMKRIPGLLPGLPNLLFRCSHHSPKFDGDHQQMCGASIFNNQDTWDREDSFCLRMHYFLAMIPESLTGATADKATVKAYHAKISAALNAIALPACHHLRVNDPTILAYALLPRPHRADHEISRLVHCKAGESCIDSPCGIHVTYSLSWGERPTLYTGLKTYRHWSPEDSAEAHM
ncbi:hypothetical protein BU16DRAFT_557091 [Lophium mytilinum]|uniref:F-box domain-containing protein n=1 Tax=Lophium mytilinum TaxID=390894 RepID=A0A6A6R8A5_9PEZI|nr:hypothetical protein BU16DRAFT_557091 [Lophium mytilinum]